MYASCATCKKSLTRGYYLTDREFLKMKEGEEFEVSEVIGCPACGKIAINWNDELYFYEENQK